MGAMVKLPGGLFRMGSECFYPEEAPVRDVALAPFWIDQAPVTNRQFAAFVRDTNYITVAERVPDPAEFPDVDASRLKPGALTFRPVNEPLPVLDWRTWWRYSRGAHWRKPEGQGTVFAGRLDHPVTCVAYEDAHAFANWAGKRLPSEAEWEYAARGGLHAADYAWGDLFMPDGRRMANTWVGRFPIEPDRKRKFWTTAIGSFPANGFGLLDMIGNVWEWTSDWYQFDLTAVAMSCCAERPPAAAFNPAAPEAKHPYKVVKGGSFLCSSEYCARYRPSARQPQSVDTASMHIGFRCARDVQL